MSTIVQYVLFILLYKVLLLSSLWIKTTSATIQMKTTEQYFLAVYYAVQSGSQ